MSRIWKYIESASRALAPCWRKATWWYWVDLSGRCHRADGQMAGGRAQRSDLPRTVAGGQTLISLWALPGQVLPGQVIRELVETIAS